MVCSPDVDALIEGLLRETAALRKDIAGLRLENAVLKQEVADLRRRLGKDSSNSSQPPSSDGPAKKQRIAGSLRGVSGKKSGGQPGHRGDTLRPVSKPDKIERHEATQCGHCQAGLTAAMATRVEKRQVFEMPRPRLEVTEHQAHIYTCAGCRGVTRAAFPADVTAHVQYGPRIRAAAIYLNAQHLVPEDRVGEIMHDLFGAALLCPASIAGWGELKAQEWAVVEAHIAAQVATAAVRHLDETGFRIGGKTRWLHTASTATLTYYRVSEQRGEMFGDLRGGVIVHDHFKPYFTLAEVEHALCNAHHLRELKALIDIEKEPWARKMSRLLVRAAKRAERAIAQGKTELVAGCARRIVAVFDEILRRGFAFHQAQPPLARRAGARGRSPKRVGHNLLGRLHDHKTEVLRFVFDFAVPFTNNQAEQDIRMMKVKMKVSGGFRTQTGAETFATLRSVLSTARKQGMNILRALTAAPASLIQDWSG
jgi:transposase